MSNALEAKKQQLEMAMKTQKALKSELAYLESLEEDFKQQSDDEQIAQIRQKL